MESVPSLKSYVDDHGVYIRAWVPETGNVTYQVGTTAETVLTETGFESGDEIPWKVVTVLRKVGLIYIGEGEDSEFETDQDDFTPTEPLDGLSPEAGPELIGALKMASNIGSEQIAEIEELLGTSDLSNSKTDDLATEITARCEKLIANGEFTSTVFEQGELRVNVESTEDSGYRLSGGISEFNDEYGQIFFSIKVDQQTGINEITAAVEPSVLNNTGMDWEMRRETHKAIGDLLPIVASSLRHKNIDPGSPTKNISTEISQI